MIHRSSCLALMLVLAGCPVIKPPPLQPLSSFRVEALGLFVGTGASRTPLNVVTVCAMKYGDQSMVPATEKGTKTCPYAIARGEIEIDISATALDQIIMLPRSRNP